MKLDFTNEEYKLILENAKKTIAETGKVRVAQSKSTIFKALLLKDLNDRTCMFHPTWGFYRVDGDFFYEYFTVIECEGTRLDITANAWELVDDECNEYVAGFTSSPLGNNQKPNGCYVDLLTGDHFSSLRLTRSVQTFDSTTMSRVHENETVHFLNRTRKMQGKHTVRALEQQGIVPVTSMVYTRLVQL